MTVGCAGFCPCPADGKDVVAHQEAMYCPRGYFGTGEYPVGWESRGLGDVVAKITHAVGIHPCGGCKKRREEWNEAVSFNRSGGGPPR
jgi:hypothetical protein